MVKKLATLDMNKCIGCMECMFACSRRVGRGGFDKSAISVRSAGHVRTRHVQRSVLRVRYMSGKAEE